MKITTFFTQPKFKLTLGLAIVAVLVALPSAVNAQSLRNSVSCGSNINYDVKNGGECEDKDQAARERACLDRDALRGENREEKANRCANSTSDAGQFERLIKTVINILSAIAGTLAIIFIIIGGFRYVTSGGDSNNVGAAKNTIIYAIVGLLIVAFAQIIVKFVLGSTT